MKTVFCVMSTVICVVSIVLVIVLGTGFCILSDQDRDVQLVNEILGKSAKIIRDKYKIQPSGSGVAMPGGPIQELTLAFNTTASYNKKELRELLIKCANELVDQVNKNEEIQQYILKPPFTMENADIIIYNHDKDGRGLRDPEISIARISLGILMFRTIDSENEFRFKQNFKETYEEALEAVRVGHEKVPDQKNNLPSDRVFSFPTETTKQGE